MKVNDFDYKLPESLIAQYPLDRRDESKLMVLDRENKKIYHRYFSDLEEYMDEGDLIICNNTKVFPAKVFLKKVSSSALMEGLILKVEDDGCLEMLIKKSKRLSENSEVVFGESSLKGKVIKKDQEGKCFIKVPDKEIFLECLNKEGYIPLPHYIKREEGTSREFDKLRYQTIFAKNTGSIAAPTAGLHFTPAIIKNLEKKGTKMTELTLHVGYATFKPIRVDEVSNHTMEEEYYQISPQIISQINQAKRSKKRVIAVGTTSTRALESWGNTGKSDHRTGIFIYPGYRFKVIDCLLTNFHLPCSTLLMLVCAFGGTDFILSAYREAVKKDYRFFSYGDAMLIL